MQKTLVIVKSQTVQARAQIAFITSESWCIRGEYFSHSGLFEFAQMPVLPAGVPILSIGCAKDQELVKRIIRRHCSPAGVDDVESVVRLLVACGAQVAYSV